MKTIPYNKLSAPTDTTTSELCKKFRDHGHRITKARNTILDALSNATKHMSVDDIYLAIRKAGKNAGITTIYRALDSMVKAGVVRKMALAGGRTYYEVSDKKISGHHHHLICRKCQTIIDYADFVAEEIELVSKLEKIVAKVHKFTVDDHQIAFTGLCKLCK